MVIWTQYSDFNSAYLAQYTAYTQENIKASRAG